MKNFYLVFLFIITISVNAQISVQGTENGSVTISPKGFQGKSNSAAATSGNLSLGSNVLKNSIFYNLFIIKGLSNGNSNSNSLLFSIILGFQNIALGDQTFQNVQIGITENTNSTKIPLLISCIN